MDSLILLNTYGFFLEYSYDFENTISCREKWSYNRKTINLLSRKFTKFVMFHLFFFKIHMLWENVFYLQEEENNI